MRYIDFTPTKEVEEYNNLKRYIWLTIRMLHHILIYIDVYDTDDRVLQKHYRNLNNSSTITFIYFKILSDPHKKHLITWTGESYIYIYIHMCEWSCQRSVVGSREMCCEAFSVTLCAGFLRNASLWLSEGNAAKNTFRRFPCNGRAAGRHSEKLLLFQPKITSYSCQRSYLTSHVCICSHKCRCTVYIRRTSPSASLSILLSSETTQRRSCRDGDPEVQWCVSAARCRCG